jgi:hypothetical protein
MKTIMKLLLRKIFFLLIALIAIPSVFAQSQISNVEFEAEQTEILKSTSTTYGNGTLSSGEAITNECA